MMITTKDSTTAKVNDDDEDTATPLVPSSTTRYVGLDRVPAPVMGRETVNGVCADLIKMNNCIHDLKEELNSARDQSAILQTQLRTAVSEEKEKNLQLVKEYERTIYERVEARVSTRIQAIEESHQEQLTQMQTHYEHLLVSQKTQLCTQVEQQSLMGTLLREQIEQLTDKYRTVTSAQREEIQSLRRHFSTNLVIFITLVVLLLITLGRLYTQLADLRAEHARQNSHTQLTCERQLGNMSTSLSDRVRDMNVLHACKSMLTNITQNMNQAMDHLQTAKQIRSSSFCSWWPISSWLGVEMYNTAVDSAFEALKYITHQSIVRQPAYSFEV